MQILPILKSNPEEAPYKYLYDFFYLKRQASYYIYYNAENSTLDFRSWHQSGTIKIEDWIDIISGFSGKLNPEVLEFYRSKI